MTAYKNNRANGLVLLAILCLTAGRLAAQATEPSDAAGGNGSFSADRPGVSDAPDVVPGGAMQLETGVTLSEQTNPGVVEHDVISGSPLLRLGIGHGVELRIETNGLHNWTSQGADGAQRARGLSDFAMAAKIKLREEKGWIPALALVPQLSLPTGASQFTSSSLDPSLELAWGKTLVHGFSTIGNIVSTWTTETGRRLIQRDYSVAVSHNLPRHLGGYVEAYKISPSEGASAWTIDAGVTRSIGPNMQADLEFGRGIDSIAPSWFVGGGFAFRMPSRLAWFNGVR